MAKRKETVTRVIDGDTFRTTSRKHSVRLANVDTPEKGTKGGAKATQRLKNLIQGRKVEVNTVARDAYGRAVAKVKRGGIDVNKAMVNFRTFDHELTPLSKKVSKVIKNHKSRLWAILPIFTFSKSAKLNLWQKTQKSNTSDSFNLCLPFCLRLSNSRTICKLLHSRLNLTTSLRV